MSVRICIVLYMFWMYKLSYFKFRFLKIRSEYWGVRIIQVSD